MSEQLDKLFELSQRINRYKQLSDVYDDALDLVIKDFNSMDIHAVIVGDNISVDGFNLFLNKHEIIMNKNIFEDFAIPVKLKSKMKSIIIDTITIQF